MWMGVNAPNRLRRLVLSNTAAKIGTTEMWDTRIETARKDGMKPIAASVIERWFTPEFRATYPDRAARTQKMIENTSPEGYAGCCTALREIDLRNDVARIKIPTLIVYGAKDPVTPAANAEFLGERIQGAAKVGLNAAHLSNVEQADQFTETVKNFLSN